MKYNNFKILILLIMFAISYFFFKETEDTKSELCLFYITILLFLNSVKQDDGNNI